MSADALKECPHCGSPAQLEDCRTIWRAICTSAACGALVLGDRAPEPEDGDEYPAGYWEAFEKSAIDRWNARPAIAPPVAAGSVDTLARYRLYYDDSDVVQEADPDGDYVLHADAIAWGAQQREAEKLKVEQSIVLAVDQAHQRAEFAQKQWDNWVASANEWKARAEKAETERDTLKESLRLVNEDHGLWMARTHAAEDARDDALARAKELEERVENLDTLHVAPFGTPIIPTTWSDK